MSDYSALKAAVELCLLNDVWVPDDIMSGLAHARGDAEVWTAPILKTVDWYERAMWKAVRDLYNSEIGIMEFETAMIDIIQNQLRRAWNEGMRSLGLDPETEMTLLWEMTLQDIMAQELIYVDPLAAEIMDAALVGENIDQFRARVDLWANRYNDVVNQATQICAQAGQKMKWQYGDTAHCNTCEQLDGIVAFESEWEQAGIYPQRPPNPLLECGGWKCQCTLSPTDQRRSPNALDILLIIGTRI